MSFRFDPDLQRNYLGVMEFARRYPAESACEDHLIKLKYPQGFNCRRCGGRKYYKLLGPALKRRRLLQCADNACKAQMSLTSGTMFHGSKLPLLKWFWALFLVTQTKKGISGRLLSKQIHVAESTALLMLYKIRKEMEEDAINYQIGGEGYVVQADEIEIGGKNADKQTVLMLLELEELGNKLKIGRVRLTPIPDKRMETMEMNLVPLIAKGTKLHTDGNQTYSRIAIRNFRRLSHQGVAHWEEGYTYEFLKQLNMIAGNLQRWILGIHHHLAPHNMAYYMNEFAYRFNRRRSEKNIFDRLLRRSVERPKILTASDFANLDYLPLAS